MRALSENTRIKRDNHNKNERLRKGVKGFTGTSTVSEEREKKILKVIKKFK